MATAQRMTSSDSGLNSSTRWTIVGLLAASITINLLDRQVLSVARVTAPLFGESKVGFIVTNGDPTGLSKNSVAGADIQLRDSNFRPGVVAQADFYYQRSFSSTKGDDDSYGAALNFPNEPWGGDAYFKQIGADFAPALGFVNRTGVRLYDGRIVHRDRNAGWRFLDFSTTWNIATGLDNVLQSRENIVEAAVSTQFTDEFHLRVIDDYENVPSEFKLASTVPVPVGEYHWTNVGGMIRTSDGRPITAELDVVCCSF